MWPCEIEFFVKCKWKRLCTSQNFYAQKSDSLEDIYEIVLLSLSVIKGFLCQHSSHWALNT